MLLTGQIPNHYRVPELGGLPRPLYVRAFEIPADSEVAMHSHPWAQFMHASAGVLCVHTPLGRHMVPPQHAIWIPPGMAHGVTTHGRIAFHSLYLDPGALEGPGPDCKALVVTPLLRALLHETRTLPADYRPDSADGRLVAVILDQIARLPAAPLCLPMPGDPRLLRIALALQADPGNDRTLEAWGQRVGATRRTLARRFRDETRLTFSEWRLSLRMLAALPRLEAGTPVTTVAAELGYASLSAFIAAFRRFHGSTPGAFFDRNATRR